MKLIPSTTGLRFLAILLFISIIIVSCAKPDVSARPNPADSTNVDTTTYYPDTVTYWYPFIDPIKYVYVYDGTQRIKGIDIYDVESTSNEYMLLYKYVYEYNGSSNLPFRKHFFDVLGSPFPEHTSYMQYDLEGRKIYDSCRDRVSPLLYTAVTLNYPDSSHIVVHQTIKNGPVEYATDTLFLRHTRQVDSIRRYSDASFAYPATYVYTQYFTYNDTVPNMFSKLSTRHADLYAPTPLYQAHFNATPTNSFNYLQFSTYTTNIPFEDTYYFRPYYEYPNNKKSLVSIRISTDSMGFNTASNYRFTYWQ